LGAPASIELLGLAVKDLWVNSSGLEPEESNTQSLSEMIVERNVEGEYDFSAHKY